MFGQKIINIGKRNWHEIRPSNQATAFGRYASFFQPWSSFPIYFLWILFKRLRKNSIHDFKNVKFLSVRWNERNKIRKGLSGKDILWMHKVHGCTIMKCNQINENKYEKKTPTLLLFRWQWVLILEYYYYYYYIIIRRE